ncbi:MauE/DoxX family redox-associated membrane protein [Actinomadura sp. 1N219]|uniref:MauE/DoxX family redox-associated membrane protein n=1 Tax=Actinomadura sp. 1N219 TaxID=3375152 RepID=UPI0037A075ED
MEQHFVVGAAYLLAAVFLIACATKLRSRSGFRLFVTTTGKLTKLSEPVARWVAAGVLVCEATIALLLALPATARLGFFLAGALLSVFIGAVYRAVRGGVFAECGCFGDRSAMLSYPLLARNALLLLVALPGMIVGAGPEGFGYPHSVVAAAAGVLVAIGFVHYYDDLSTKVLLRMQRRAAAEPSRPAAPR